MANTITNFPDTSSIDMTVRIRNLDTGQQVGQELVFPAAVQALATAPGDRLVVGFHWDVAVLAHLNPRQNTSDTSSPQI